MRFTVIAFTSKKATAAAASADYVLRSAADSQTVSPLSHAPLFPTNHILSPQYLLVLCAAAAAMPVVQRVITSFVERLLP